ncbi:hypothetical protein BDF14DRAFT_379277 [Spinellus fusiger]|nr:hypothetical protein BDF14DRAFT_379277 [Spinellus fusiger]
MKIFTKTETETFHSKNALNTSSLVEISEKGFPLSRPAIYPLVYSKHPPTLRNSGGLKKRSMAASLCLGKLPEPKLLSDSQDFFSAVIQQKKEKTCEIFSVRMPPYAIFPSISTLSNTRLACMKPLPYWLETLAIEPNGPQQLLESYKIIENDEHRRLIHLVKHHSRNANNLDAHPFSIVQGIERGALNRYSNIWPFEHTRVKLLAGQEDYINASYIQYNTSPLAAMTAFWIL